MNKNPNKSHENGNNFFIAKLFTAISFYCAASCAYCSALNEDANFYQWQRSNFVALDAGSLTKTGNALGSTETRLTWIDRSYNATMDSFENIDDLQSSSKETEIRLESSLMAMEDINLNLRFSHNQKKVQTQWNDEQLNDTRASNTFQYGLGYNLAGRTGIQFRMIHSLENYANETGLGNEKYYANLLGIGLDLAWLPQAFGQRLHILFSYQSPLKGSTVIYSESRLVTQPGHIDYNAKYAINPKISTALNFRHWLHKRDELNGEIESNNRSYLVRSSDPSQFQFDAYRIGAGVLYQVRPRYGLQADLYLTEGNIILDDSKIPSSDKTNDTYTYLNFGFGINAQIGRSGASASHFSPYLSLLYEVVRLDHESQNQDAGREYQNYSLAKNTWSIAMTASF